MILVVDPDRGFRSRIEQELGREGLLAAEGLHELDRLLAEHRDLLEVMIFGPGLASAEALRAADSMQVRAPGVAILMVASAQTSEMLHGALRAGVRDVLPVSFLPNELREAVSRAGNLARQLRGRASPSERKRRVGKVVTIFSSKGGCGKSVVSSNLAVLLAQTTTQPVALVDLDLQSGDLAIMLGLLPAWTIYDASEHLDRLDSEALRGYLTPHRSKAMLLAAPLEPSLAEAVSAEGVHRILHILKETFPYVIVDGPAYFTDQVLAALDESEECVLVASMDVPSIKNLKLGLQTLGQLGMGRDRIRLVLNRADSKVGLNVGEVEKTLGTRIDVAIPSSRDVPLSVNQGSPLAAQGRKSSVVNAIAGLADLVRARPEHNETAHRSSPAWG
ncbi:MAG: AAA family ATPase [Actinomycetota bacterium]